jgi:hypothetical protein
MRWAEGADDDLRRLLGRAAAVPPIKLRAEREMGVPLTADGSSGDGVVDESDPLDVTDLMVVRTFRYPGGRLWTVSVVAHPDDGGPPRLRFVSGARFIDLPRWSREWPDYPDERLVELMRAAAPRPAVEAPEPGTPRRRWNDAPEAARG